MSDIELFDGLVSPEVANVLDEAMRAMPDSAVHVTPGQADWGRVHVAIGGEMYDLMVTLDGDTVASFKLVPVCVGRAGNVLKVLPAALGVWCAAMALAGLTQRVGTQWEALPASLDVLDSLDAEAVPA